MTKSFDHDEYLKEYKKRVLTRLTMDMKKEKRDVIREHADRCGETLTGYIKKAVEMRMAIDDSGIEPTKEEKHDEEEKENATAAARNEELIRSYGTSVGDIGRAVAEENRKKGRMVKDGDHGFRVVYAPDDT